MYQSGLAILFSAFASVLSAVLTAMTVKIIESGQARLRNLVWTMDSQSVPFWLLVGLFGFSAVWAAASALVGLAIALGTRSERLNVAAKILGVRWPD
jgi:hypothetical protein